MSYSDTSVGYLRLAGVRGIGPTIGRQLVQAVDGIERLWNRSEKELREIDGVGPKLAAALLKSSEKDADSVLARCRTEGIDICSIDDDDYPELLKSCDDAPLLLFVQGDTKALNGQLMLAIVGARKASRESRMIARRWSAYCSGLGVSIVSGMAYGIDAAAHGGALEGESPTVAVLGCGLAVLAEGQRKQADAVAGQGCVVSEFFPDVTARAEHFPQRNRIIAGLAEATLVIEAGIRSGSMITARQALGYGREVMAVPGSVLNESHAGCHQLIRDGALLIDSAEEMLRYLGWSQLQQSPVQGYEPDSAEERKIIEVLQRETVHLDALADACNLTVPQLSPFLLALELQGVINRLPGSRFSIGGRVDERSRRGGVPRQSENH